MTGILSTLIIQIAMSKRAIRSDEGPRVNIPAKAPKSVKQAIETLARDEDRAFSNMVARLLETHPRVRSRIEELKSSAQPA